MYRAHLKWRVKVGADYILEEFPKSPWFEFTCKHYPASHSDAACPKVLRARDGSHLCIEMMGNLNVEAITSGFVPLDEVMRYHIWSMEHNENLRRQFCKENGYKELVQAVVIEDLQGLGMGHLNMMYVIQQFTAIDSVNYPELLRKVFVLNVPPVFGMVWNGVKYIWSSGQTDRMKFISSGSSDLTKELTTVIHPDNLPKIYGGNLDYSPPARSSYDDIIAQVKAIPKKEFVTETVSRSSKLTKDFVVGEGSDQLGKSVHYEFKTDDYEIRYEVTYEANGAKPVSIIEMSEVNSHQIPVFGRWKLDKPGKYSITFDNNSWVREKTLHYTLKTLDR